MALDYMRIVSQGVYPTPTPTGASRMASAVSQGLINFVLGEGSAPDIADTFFKLIRGGAKLFTTGAKIFLRR